MTTHPGADGDTSARRSVTLEGLRNLLHPLRRRQVVFCNPTEHPIVEMALRTLRQEGYEVAAKPSTIVEEGTAYVVDADLLQPTAFIKPFGRPS